MLFESKVGADRIIIHGEPGVGKSTFFSGFPGVVFLGKEDGIAGVRRAPLLKEWKELFTQFAWIKANHQKERIQTVVIDTIDSIISLAEKEVCKRHGWATLADGDYGKGVAAIATEAWVPLVDALDSMRDLGITIGVISHSEVKTQKRADNNEYQQFVPNLPPKLLALLCQWSDVIGFAQRPVTASKGKASGVGSRVLRVNAAVPFFLGKVRGTLKFASDKFELTYAAYAANRVASDTNEIKDQKEVTE